MKRRLLACVLLCALLGMPCALAHQVRSAVAPAGLSQTGSSYNLSSTKQLFSAENLGTFAAQILRVGQRTLTVTDSSMLTAAEMLALGQELAGGPQTLVLNGRGQATGGDFQIAGLLSQSVSGLYIPRGVTAIDNLSLLNFSGNLVNAGRLLLVSSASGATQDSISALNIDNLSGGLLTSNVNAVSAVGPATAHLSISLKALDNMVNAGTISSAGDLSVYAGGSIANAGSRSGAQAVMQGAGSVNLASGTGTFTNSGLISALSGNLNLATPETTDLNFNNAGGALQALNGAINFRDATFSDDNNLTLTGGNLSAQSVNIYSGSGVVSADVDQMNGLVNATAGCAHIVAATNTLDLGAMNLSGDPTFYNTNGDILLNTDFIFPGQALALVASGDIIASRINISTSSDTGDGGSIIMIAGADLKVLTGGQLLVYGGTSQGGSINLAAVNGGLQSLTATSSSKNGNGGDITLVAYAGTNFGSGTIAIPSSITIQTGGNGTGANGDVNIIAGASSGAAISVGDINTAGGSGGLGNIAIAAGQPQIGSPFYFVWADSFNVMTQPENNLVSDADVLIEPSGSVNYNYGFFRSLTSVSPGNVQTGDLTAPGSLITIFAGGAVQTGTIDVSSPGRFNGVINIVAGNGIAISGALMANTSSSTAGSIGLWSTAGGISVAGDVGANCSTGSGGNILFSSSSGSVTISGSVTAEGLLAGTISLSVADGSLSVGGSVLANGSNGSVTLSNQQGDIAIYGSVSANAANLSGSAGTIAISTSNGGITVGGSVLANSNCNSGNCGGTINISTANGTVFVNGSVGADGGGGAVSISLASSSPFVIGEATVNGIAGNLTANGINGNGGSLSVTNNGVGGITVSNEQNLSVSASTTGGFGGSITLNAGAGVLTMAQGALSVNAEGGLTVATPGPVIVQPIPCDGCDSGDVVSVQLQAQAISSVNVCCFGEEVFVLGGSPCCFGGQITLEGSAIVVTGVNGNQATGTLNLSANGSGQGNAGSISLIATGGNLTIGNQPGQINVTAVSGASYGTGSPATYINQNVPSYYQNNSISAQSLPLTGELYVSTGGNLTVDPTAINIGPAAGTDANGANIILIAGTSPSGGNLLITGSLSANGSRFGNGGVIVLASNSNSPFIVSSTATNIVNGVDGVITANSGSYYTETSVWVAPVDVSSSPGITTVIASSVSNSSAQVDVSSLVGPNTATVSSDDVVTFPGPGYSTGSWITEYSGPNGGLIIVASANGMSSDAGAIQTTSTYGSQGGNINMTLSNAVTNGLLCCAGGAKVNISPVYEWVSSGFGVANFSTLTLSISGVPLPNYENNKPTSEYFSYDSNIQNATTGSAYDVQSPTGILVEDVGTAPNPLPTVVVDANRLVERVLSSSQSSQASNGSGQSSTILDTDVTQFGLPAGDNQASLGNNESDSQYQSGNELIAYTPVTATGQIVSKLGRGSILLAPESDTTITTPQGLVKIRKGSIALLTETGSELAVYDFHDRHNDCVTITVGKSVLGLSPGKQLVLAAKGPRSFDQVNPNKAIAHRQLHSFATENNLTAYVSEFSIVSAIAHNVELQRMIDSGETKNKINTANLFKTAAVLSRVNSNHGPFKVPKHPKAIAYEG